MVRPLQTFFSLFALKTVVNVFGLDGFDFGKQVTETSKKHHIPKTGQSLSLQF
jgi:hypothetical protein